MRSAKQAAITQHLLARLVYAPAGQTVQVIAGSRSSAANYIRSLESVVRSCKADVVATYYRHDGRSVTVNWWHLGFRKP